jgi:hypothetical protein
MRIKITMFLSVLFLTLSVLSIAQPAVAAPAQTYNESSCFDGGQFCITSRGVYQEQTTGSGITKATYNGSYEVIVRGENGQVIYQDASKDSSTFVYKNGEPQVSRQRYTGSFSYEGETCTFGYAVVYANGAVRHEDETFDCN